MDAKDYGVMFILSSPSGAGKTTLTKKIAEENSNFSISISHTTRTPRPNEINGEDYFRKIEEEITLSYLKLNNKVISLGGGGYINQNIRRQCLKNCVSIWLNWRDETLINRIERSKKRPLAIKLSSNEIKRLIFERSKIYNSSNFKINCDKLDKNQIVKRIINRLH